MAKNTKPLPSQEILKKLIRYDEKTGKLFWNVRPIEFFTAEGHSPAHSRAKWNSRWAGKEAMIKMNVGYRCGRLLYQSVLAHRVIWKLMTGEEAIEIDHINGNRSDNRFENLRNVSTLVNRRNSAMRSDNTSGVNGIIWDKRSKKWVVRIQFGSFNTREEACAARKKAEVLLGFHPNHGRTALT